MEKNYSPPRQRNKLAKRTNKETFYYKDKNLHNSYTQDFTTGLPWWLRG